MKVVGHPKTTPETKDWMIYRNYVRLLKYLLIEITESMIWMNLWCKSIFRLSPLEKALELIDGLLKTRKGHS